MRLYSSRPPITTQPRFGTFNAAGKARIDLALADEKLIIPPEAAQFAEAVHCLERMRVNYWDDDYAYGRDDYAYGREARDQARFVQLLAGLPRAYRTLVAAIVQQAPVIGFGDNENLSKAIVGFLRGK